MRLDTSSRGNPQSGASPAMRSKSGKPLKNSPKKPSKSPGTNQRADCGGAEPQVALVALKRSRTSSRFFSATACKPRLCDLNANAILQIQRQQLRTLGLHDGN